MIRSMPFLYFDLYVTIFEIIQSIYLPINANMRICVMNDLWNRQAVFFFFNKYAKERIY